MFHRCCSRPDVALGLDRVLSVTDSEAARHGTMARRADGGRASGNEIERLVTDWEFRE
jgi:hypothetical protein